MTVLRWAAPKGGDDDLGDNCGTPAPLNQLPGVLAFTLGKSFLLDPGTTHMKFRAEFNWKSFTQQAEWA